MSLFPGGDKRQLPTVSTLLLEREIVTCGEGGISKEFLASCAMTTHQLGLQAKDSFAGIRRRCADGWSLREAPEWKGRKRSARSTGAVP